MTSGRLVLKGLQLRESGKVCPRMELNKLGRRRGRVWTPRGRILLIQMKIFGSRRFPWALFAVMLLSGLQAACNSVSQTRETSAQPQTSMPTRMKIDVSKLGPQVGERVPDFSLKDQAGKTWTLRSIMGPKGAMLVFVRSADW